MRGFLLGLLTAGLGFGAYLFWQHQKSGVAAREPGSADAGAKTATKKVRKHSRGAVRLARGPVGEMPAAADSDSEPVRLSAADLRLVAQGDDLSRPDILRLDMSNDKELPELGQDQIDERFRAEEDAILGCITRARPDPETYVPGRVTIKFRIQRAGTVRGVRVEAPAVLQRNGLFGCIQGVVGRLRFPAAGTSQIISYPFKLS
jgi:hypothetical protein